jgi:hypothetical protein
LPFIGSPAQGMTPCDAPCGPMRATARAPGPVHGCSLSRFRLRRCIAAAPCCRAEKGFQSRLSKSVALGEFCLMDSMV